MRLLMCHVHSLRSLGNLARCTINTPHLILLLDHLKAPNNQRLSFHYALLEQVDNEPLTWSGTRVTLGWSILLIMMLPFAIHAECVGLIGQRKHLPKLDFAAGSMQWVKLALFLLMHAKCETHKQAMTCWNDHTINTQGHTTVVHRLDSAQKQLIESNRHYIRTVAEVLFLCAKQDLALCGHRENYESKNRGNFKEILTLVANLSD